MALQKKSSQSADRHLTVYQKYVRRAWSQYAIMPEIRLCGKWLQEAGFKCGDEVTVKCFEKKIEITVDPAAE